MNNLIADFKEYCEYRNWKFDKYASEFTFQFRLCRFLDSKFGDKLNIELESNIQRHDLSNLTKKEIDIELYNSKQERTAIELKFIRDQGSFNIGMFRFCEDIRFIEELKENGFNGGYAIVFTTIPELYTAPRRELNPKNKENLKLYTSFRKEFSLSGKLQIKTGNLRGAVYLNGSYNLDWHDFTDGIKVCLVEVK